MHTPQTHYRQLHRIPEASGQEYRTASYIENILTQAGYVPRRIGQTAVFADLVTDPDLPWLLLRADMDALPMEEKSGCAFPSENKGFMHACGHDAHCAMLLAAAEHLQGKKLPQNIRFLFQPAEETTLGAAEVVAGGVIPAQTAACFAIHVWPGLPEGRLFTKVGALMASSDVFWIHIRGRSAHCAQSHRGADALQTAVAIAASCPEIRKRAQQEAIVFCGTVSSGCSHNVVPNKGLVGGTIRTYSEQDRQRMRELLTASAQESAAHFGTTFEIQWQGGCPAVYNDPSVVAVLTDVLPELDTNAQPTMAGEDFALFQKQVPGALLWLGTGDTPPLHNEAFYVPEQILNKGVDAFLTIAARDWQKVL